MRNKRQAILILLIITTLLLTNACRFTTSQSARTFGIFRVLDDDKTVEMDGDITTASLSDFQQLLNKYPDIKRINIVNCDGSLDDEANLKLSKLVHDKAISTHVLDDGVIASGGVDFFLSGVKRTIGKNVKIGVHSWSGETEVATDFPKGHKNHLPYIEYYKSIGFTQKEAEDFYYFTINIAPANGIHYMSEEEMATYKIIVE